jgi:hypothetical protein
VVCAGVLGQVQEQWQLFVVYAVFAAGWSAAGLVPVTTVVTRWFHTRRSVALSVASTGLSAGGILITPLAKRLLDQQGLAAGTPWLGALFVVGIVPVAWFVVRPDPEAEGWAPDGARRAVGEVPLPPGVFTVRRGGAHPVLPVRHHRIRPRVRCAGRWHPAARQAGRGAHRSPDRPVRDHRHRRHLGGGAPDRWSCRAVRADDALTVGLAAMQAWRWRCSLSPNRPG